MGQLHFRRQPVMNRVALSHSALGVKLEGPEPDCLCHGF